MDNCTVAKYIIIGESGTGKSSLAKSYTIENYVLDDRMATIGVEFHSIYKKLADGRQIKIHIWDTAGQEKFRSITHSYYRGANGACLVFSLGSKDSFNGLTRFIEDLATYTNNIPTILVGTFGDLSEEYCQVLDEEAIQLGLKHDMKYFRVSCKTGFGIESAFNELSRQVCDALDEKNGCDDDKILLDDGGRGKKCCF